MTPEERAEAALSRMIRDMHEVFHLSCYAWTEIRKELVAAIRDAILEEREACAKVAELNCKDLAACADAIRERT